MYNFSAMGLAVRLTYALVQQGFITPTPIQAQAIPPALEGRDVLGSANTGTGKTMAFAIPLVAHLMQNPTSTALVLTPTRELALQVCTQIKALLQNAPKPQGNASRAFKWDRSKDEATRGNSAIRTALLIGGEAIPKQIQQLKQRPRLIVGTPGRINDHLVRKSVCLERCDFLVLDETDRMLDMGFAVQIDQILTTMPEVRQTLLFSATLPKAIVATAQEYLSAPVRISIQAPIGENLHQEVFPISEAEKYPHFLNQLRECTGTAIVFVKTKYKEGLRAEALHGDMRQNKRDAVIRKFRQSHFDFLIATDVAARGLDILHIAHIINYDLPQCPEDYIHRIGRTARAGASGTASCYVTPADKARWSAIHRLLNPNARSERVAPSDQKTKLYSKKAHSPHWKSQKGRPRRRSTAA